MGFGLVISGGVLERGESERSRAGSGGNATPGPQCPLCQLAQPACEVEEDRSLILDAAVLLAAGCTLLALHRRSACGRFARLNGVKQYGSIR